MLLKDLLKDEDGLLKDAREAEGAEVGKFLNIKIKEIKNDSRAVEAGDLFFAIKGYNVDGAKFIGDVIGKDVRVVICHKDSDVVEYDKSKVLVLRTGEQKALLGRMLNRMYPKLPKYIVGVTGTNGKTTVVELTRQAIAQLGINVATIGSLGVTYVVDGKEKKISYKHDLTNPDLIELYKYLDLLKRDGVDYVVMEASSQGMRNGRMEGLLLDAGAFTNISRDHIGISAELHKDKEDYFNWKMFLFEELVKKNGYAVVNADVSEYDMVAKIAKRRRQKVLDYGINGKAIKIKSAISSKVGQDVEIEFGAGGNLKFKTNLIGEFQVSNLCAVIGFLIALGFRDRLEEVNFEELNAPKGRAELMGTLPNGAKIYMDYPSTEDALKNTIVAFKKFQKTVSGGRVIILFGAGGDRDPAKRSKMGKVATDFADLVIVTEDSPRSENPAKIRADIMAGCDKSKAVNIGNEKEGETVEGRIRAVEYAMSVLEKNDILITNKGHERHILINNIDAHYDEEKLLKDLIRKMGGVVRK
jgi:UDP-N-acetylmuramoyl-L-alanyl-D-glutamate--2,6-diaminopimelate ligase